MSDADRPSLIDDLRRLIEEHYVFPDIAAAIAQRLTDGVAAGRYSANPAGAADPATPAGPSTTADPATTANPAGPTGPSTTAHPAGNASNPGDLAGFAAAVTADLQADSHDKHLRVIYHDEPIPESTPGDDAEEWAAMRRWAAATCSGVAAVARREGTVGYLNLDPVLFPTPIAAEHVSAAFTVLADCDALVLDLRACLGGEPTMVAFIASYLWDDEPAQLTSLRHRSGDVTQSWTLPYVPGRRFGRHRPLYVLTSATTFSGGEQLAYDLQQLGRATIVGERTRGGANARAAYRLSPHLEATIPVAASVNPRSGTNWEGTGVTPDVEVSAAEAEATAYQLIAVARTTGEVSRSTDD